MIARTKIQKQVQDLSIKHFTKPHPEHNFNIQIISDEHKEWVFKNCFEHLVFATKHKAGCMDCGATFPTSHIKNEKIECPECHTLLKAVHSNTRIYSQACYVSLAVVVEGFQVIRNFYAHAYYKKGQKCQFSMHEKLQYWASPKGELVMYGRLPNAYSDSWSGDMECRINRGSYWGGNKYIIDPKAWLPGSRLKKEIRAIGIGLGKKKPSHGFHFLDAVPILLNNPMGETLYKAGHKEFLQVMVEKPKLINSLWPSIKICFRQKYKFKSVTTWIDYMEMLKKYGRDIRSPKYICPVDLDKEHNRYVEKERRAREIERQRMRVIELARQLKKSAHLEKDYAKRKAPYIGLEFLNDVYSAHFLNSIKEFQEEGETMRHCVFSREYYNEPSLLFSIRKQGEKIATAELSIKTWRVLQVRTFHNNVSPETKKITQFIEENFKVIQDCTKPKKKRVTKQKLQLAS